MAGLHSQKSNTESVGSSVDGDGSDDEYDLYDYYNEGDLSETEEALNEAVARKDLEHYEFSCVTYKSIWDIIKQQVDRLHQELKISFADAFNQLATCNWNTELAVHKHTKKTKSSIQNKGQEMVSCCPVCLSSSEDVRLFGLTCGHHFCFDCWLQHIKCQVETGSSIAIQCMSCPTRVGFEMVEQLLADYPNLFSRYLKFSVTEYTQSQPLLRWCPGKDCSMVFQVEQAAAKRVICKSCTACVCFMCGDAYHCPTTCDIIKKWLVKCQDDSESANYITANTKDCPNCRVCIEKNGGCNHMSCFKCRHEFCWLCMGDWKSHATEYYECSKYRADPSIADKTAGAKARAALEKYLFYYNRWENHRKSLELEKEMLKKINERIEEKVTQGEGTWIDWQYLKDAATHLTKCRYTLKYTYPYAYYMDEMRKPLFEYQQAHLEREIENLSWKVERSETTTIADLKQQMNITEIQRENLLRDFVP